MDVTKTAKGEWGMRYIDVDMPHLSYMWAELRRFNV